MVRAYAKPNPRPHIMHIVVYVHHVSGSSSLNSVQNRDQTRNQPDNLSMSQRKTNPQTLGLPCLFLSCKPKKPGYPHPDRPPSLLAPSAAPAAPQPSPRPAAASAPSAPGPPAAPRGTRRPRRWWPSQRGIQKGNRQILDGRHIVLVLFIWYTVYYIYIYKVYK